MSSVSSIGGSSAVQSAELGIQRGVSQVTRDATTVAESSSKPRGSESTRSALLDARQGAQNVEANARSLSIANQTIGTLINTKA